MRGGSLRLLGQERAPAKTVGERFGSTRRVVPIRMAGMMPASMYRKTLARQRLGAELPR